MFQSKRLRSEKGASISNFNSLDLSDPVVSLQIDLEQRIDRCERAENRVRELENENQVLYEKIRMIETFENITSKPEDVQKMSKQIETLEKDVEELDFVSSKIEQVRLPIIL
jgi:hypothetical protein